MSSPTSPYLFKEGSEENINIIKDLLKEHPHAMFLRKVSREFPDSVLKDIMDMDFGHVYPVLHNQYKVKRVEENVALTVALKKENKTLLSHFIHLRKQEHATFNMLLLLAVMIVINFL